MFEEPANYCTLDLLEVTSGDDHPIDVTRNVAPPVRLPVKRIVLNTSAPMNTPTLRRRRPRRRIVEESSDSSFSDVNSFDYGKQLIFERAANMSEDSVNSREVSIDIDDDFIDVTRPDGTFGYNFPIDEQPHKPSLYKEYKDIMIRFYVLTTMLFKSIIDILTRKTNVIYYFVKDWPIFSIVFGVLLILSILIPLLVNILNELMYILRISFQVPILPISAIIASSIFVVLFAMNPREQLRKVFRHKDYTRGHWGQTQTKNLLHMMNSHQSNEDPLIVDGKPRYPTRAAVKYAMHAKGFFGMDNLTMTRANKLVVRRYIRDEMIKNGIKMYHIAGLCDMATELTFIPTDFEIRNAKLRTRPVIADTHHQHAESSNEDYKWFNLNYWIRSKPAFNKD